MPGSGSTTFPQAKRAAAWDLLLNKTAAGPNDELAAGTADLIDKAWLLGPFAADPTAGEGGE
jgi:hypothetical protein